MNYAKAADLANLIKSQGASGGLLSKRGTVSVDERTNTLLLQDSSDRLEDIRRLVGTLDIPIRQVQIEARIVIVSDDFSRELGVRAASPAIRHGNDGCLPLRARAVCDVTRKARRQPGWWRRLAVSRRGAGR